MNSLWSNPANWSASPVPGTGDTGTFNAASTFTNIDLESGVAIQKIVFSTPASPYTIGSGGINNQTLVLDNTSGSITMNSTTPNDESINARIVLGSATATAASYALNANGTVGKSLIIAGDVVGGDGAGDRTLNLFTTSTAPGGKMLVTGVIRNGTSSAVSVNKTGKGTVTLSAANTYSGNTVFSAGALVLNNVNALQNSTLDYQAGSNVIFGVAGNNTYNLGGLQGTNNLAIGANTLRIGANNASTVYAGVIAGTGGALTKWGTGTLTLSGANTYTGGTLISSGVLALDATGAINDSSSLSIASGGSFDVSLISAFTLSGSTSLSASGTGTSVGSTAAEIKGGASVDLGSCPITLNFTPTSFSGDAVHPALYVSSGTLSLNGAITVNNNGGSPLDVGTYVLISVASASSSGSPTLNVVGGNGIAAGKIAALQINGATGNLELVVSAGGTATTTALTRHSGTGNSTTYGDALQFDVTVSPGAATGTVNLYDGGAGGILLGTGSLAGGNVTIAPAANALSAGTHTNLVAVYVGEGTYSPSASSALSAQTVAPLPLTVTGATALDKYYDTTTATTVSGGSLVGVLAGDIGNVTLTQSGTFDTAGPGTSINVTSTCFLGGSAASNYSLTQPILAANIYSAAIWNGAAADTLWNTANNWNVSIVPAGANVTATFTNLDITTDTTVNLSTARTIGNLLFSDTDTNSTANWILANNGTPSSILTLAGNTPTIAVDRLGAGATVTISAAVAGVAGLTKTGPGTLALTGTNTYTGVTAISNGVVSITADSGLGATSAGLILDGGTLSVVSPASVTLNVNRSITLGAGGGTIVQGTATRLTYAGVIAGPGALTFDAAVSDAQYAPNGVKTYSGGTTVTGDPGATVVLSGSSSGSPGSLTSGPFGIGPVTFNGPGIRSGSIVDRIVGNSISLAADTTFPTFVSGEASLELSGPITLSGGSRVLNVNIGASDNTKSLTISGAIGDGGHGYGITQSGSGNLVLSAANTYTGDTIVTAGKLLLSGSGSLASSKITVMNGATFDVSASGFAVASGQTLGGNGSVNGSVTVPSGATLTVGGNSGTDGVGTLALTGDLTLGGTTVLRINKGGTSDQISATGTLNLSGTLNVSSVGAALADGDSFQLFQAAPLAGSFSVTNLPALPSGLGWDWDNASGTLSVISNGVAAPVIGGVTYSGGNLVLTASNGVPGSTYVIISSTNVASPLINWFPVVTNTFDGTGHFTESIIVNNVQPAKFFRIKQ